ncbi:MAG: diguanylate cyclase domain-containing protein [Bacteroidota bacterium]
MAVGEYFSVDSVDPGLMRALARHLEHLVSHPDGGELYQLIEDAVLYCRENNYVNGTCVTYLHNQLLAYTRDHSHPAPMRLRARLIQQHLALYLPKPGHGAALKTAEPVAAPAAPASQKAPAPDTAVKAVSKPHPSQNTKTNPTEKPTAMESSGMPEPKPVPAAAPETPPSANPEATQNLNDLRQMLAKGMDELLHEREALARQLSDATSYLKMIEAEREQLREELNKARKRARAGDKPAKKALGLPKRDVLLRQIEAEVERVKRHGDPLALALIDVENLETINEEHGQDAANAVLNQYTSEVLGRFRSYDLVARYNKNEFAVLLPNTDKDNALRALEKVSKRAKESHFSLKGKSYPLPGFGGVLTFYSPGEEPQEMLRRADEALVNLKLRGQRQLVVV